MNKKLSLFLILILFSKLVFSGTGTVEFYNNTREMVLKINTNSSKTKKAQFKKRGGSWKDDNYGRERTLRPGDAWRIKISGTGGVPDVRPTVKVYWKDPSKAFSYRGSYTRNKDIDVKNDKTTRVYYRYRKDAAVPLERKIMFKGDGDPVESYGKTRGIGTVKFYNRTGHKIILKYKVKNSNDKFRTRVLPKGVTRVYPTGNKDNDIKYMEVRYHKDDKPTNLSGTPDRRKWSKDVSIKEGKITDIYITINKSKHFRRKVENGNLEIGEPLLKHNLIEFYNNTKEMVLKINTNSSKIKFAKFKTSGGPWKDDSFKREKILRPGDAWSVETDENSYVRPTVKVYWKDPSKEFSYRGSYTRNNKINVENDKTTRVYYRYRKDAAVPLERKITLKGDIIEDYGKKCGIGTVKFHNRTGHKIIVKYKVKNSNDKFRTRVLPKGVTRVYPTGNKDNDIKYMEVRYHPDDKPTNIYGKPDERGWSRDVAIKEGERTDIYITINNSKNFRRKIENGNIELGKSLLKDDKDLDFKGGLVRFENKTEQMVLRIDTQTSHTKGFRFKENGKKWKKSSKCNQRCILRPGDKWEVETGFFVGSPNIKARIEVYWKSQKDAKNLRQVYEPRKKIKVDRGKVTVVKFVYNNAKGGLGRQIYKPIKINETPSTIIEKYWTDGRKPPKETTLKDDLKNTSFRIINNSDYMLVLSASQSQLKTVVVNAAIEVLTFVAMGWVGKLVSRVISKIMQSSRSLNALRTSAQNALSRTAPIDGKLAYFGQLKEMSIKVCTDITSNYWNFMRFIESYVFKADKALWAKYVAQLSKIEGRAGLASRTIKNSSLVAAIGGATSGAYSIAIMPGEIVWMKGGADIHNLIVLATGGENSIGYIKSMTDFNIYERELRLKLKSKVNKIDIKNKADHSDEEKRGFWTDIYIEIDEGAGKIIVKSSMPYPKPTVYEVSEAEEALRRLIDENTTLIEELTKEINDAKVFS